MGEIISTNGLMKTLGLVGAMTGMVLSFYVVVFVNIDTQIIRIMLWVVSAGLVIVSIGLYAELLKDYDQQFLKLPSTWMTVGNFVLFVIFSVSFGTPWTVSHVNDMGVFMLVVMSGLFVGSLVTNVLRTNVIFGILLTMIQSVFLPVIVTICWFLPGLLAKSNLKSHIQPIQPGEIGSVYNWDGSNRN